MRGRLGQPRARLLAAGLGALLAALALAPAAGAASWTTTQLNAGGVRAALYGMSCPTTSLCVAVGGNGTIASSTQPLGGAGTWNVVHVGGFLGSESTTAGVTYGGDQLKDVDCPSAQLCVAASFDGQVFSSTDPAGGAWKPVELTPPKTSRIHVLGISCPGPSLCVAAAYGGTIAYSTNPTGDESDWHWFKLAQPFDFRGISCPSASLCVAVDLTGNIVSSTDPTGGPGAWTSAGAPAGPERLTAVDCPSSSLCVTGNSIQILTSTDPTGGAGAWKPVNAGTGIPITGISCPTTTACAAVDQNADVITSTDPLGGVTAWSFQNVIPFRAGMEGSVNGNGMFGLSCASTSLCAAGGASFQLIASDDPFAHEDPLKAGQGKTKGLRVVISRHPGKRVKPKRGGAHVTFGFHALGEAAGYRCKLSGHKRFRPCHSPVSYRLGEGRQIFRVRAVGRGGRLGPPASFQFRVGELSESPPAPSCANAPAGQPCVPGPHGRPAPERG